MTTYQVTARNYSAATENKIHSDEIARKLGFSGALVPGVAVFGHLTHLPVQTFGEDWLAGSVSTVRFLKPAYDQDPLSITMEEDNGRYFVRCHNRDGTLLADMITEQPENLPDPEAPTTSRETKAGGRVEINWDTVQEGQPFAPWHLQITEDGNRTYCEQIADAQPIYRYAAHPHWLLAIANRALTREYLMPAWIHVGSEIRLRSLVRVGDTLEVAAVPLEKWERKGHEFIKLHLAYHRDDVLTTEVIHTAIFKVAA